MITKNDVLNAGYKLTAVSKVRKPGLYLIGEFSHGDADAYTESDTTLDSLEEWETVNKYLAWRQTRNWNADIYYRQRTTNEQMENDFYAQAGEKWRDAYLYDTIIDWWERDVTSGGDMHARLQVYYLLYSDGSTEWRID